MDGVSDQYILTLFHDEGEAEKAFGIILDKYQERIYWHIRKIVLHHDDANDILQDTFVKIWKSLKNFRGDSELYTWMYRIATNEALSFLRSKEKRHGRRVEDPELTLANRLQSDEYFDGSEIQLKLQIEVAKLPEKQKLVFQMKYFDNMKYDDISSILDTSVGALKASYHHAVKKIKEGFSKD